MRWKCAWLKWSLRSRSTVTLGGAETQCSCLDWRILHALWIPTSWDWVFGPCEANWYCERRTCSSCKHNWIPMKLFEIWISIWMWLEGLPCLFFWSLAEVRHHPLWCLPGHEWFIKTPLTEHAMQSLYSARSVLRHYIGGHLHSAAHIWVLCCHASPASDGERRRLSAYCM